MELDVATARAGTAQRVVRVGFGRINGLTALGQPDFEHVIDTRFAHVIYHNAELNVFGDVEFGVVVDDVGEPGVNDVFKIRLTQGGQPVYTTESDSDNTLGGSGPGGGNIQLHKPDPSST